MAINIILDCDTDTCYLSRLLLNRRNGPLIVNRIMSSGVDVKMLDGTRDIWCRDYMPVQISSQTFVGYEYTPDYLTNYHDVQTDSARINRDLGIDAMQSGIILDGGNVVKTSRGIIMVDKVFKENPHIPKLRLIDRLERLFSAEIIFLPWDKVEFYGHADGIVREIENGRVLMTNYHQYDKAFAEKYIAVLSQHFNVEVLEYNVESPSEYNWCYINFLRVGNKVFLPQLEYSEDYCVTDDIGPTLVKSRRRKSKWRSHFDEDQLALAQFQRLFVGCEIIPVSCPYIVEEGGALNCISWNIKRG